jgi:hypothetical protein
MTQEFSRTMEKSSRPGPKMFVGVSHVEMLEQLGGKRKAEARDWHLKCLLGWHTKAKSAIRHILYGERTLTAQEERDIEAAFIRYHADQIEANRAEDRKHYATLRSALEYLETADPDFHRPAIEALRDVAGRLGNMVGQAGTED